MPEDKTDSAEWLAIVRQKVQSLRFGVVQIVVHESRVTQIERTERIRVNDSEHAPLTPPSLSRRTHPE
jgi:hypothetical protein